MGEMGHMGQKGAARLRRWGAGVVGALLLLVAAGGEAALVPVDCYYNAYTQEYLVAYYWQEEGQWLYVFAPRCPLYGQGRDINAGDEAIEIDGYLTDAPMAPAPDDSQSSPQADDTTTESGDHGDF